MRFPPKKNSNSSRNPKSNPSPLFKGDDDESEEDEEEDSNHPLSSLSTKLRRIKLSR